MDGDMMTISRTDYQALLDQIEDLADAATIAASVARQEALGKQAARADHMPGEFVARLVAGEHPVRVWRDHRAMTRNALAAAAGVSPSYLSEIETGRKPGSFEALTKLACVLKISLDDIAAWCVSAAPAFRLVPELSNPDGLLNHCLSTGYGGAQGRI